MLLDFKQRPRNPLMGNTISSMVRKSGLRTEYGQIIAQQRYVQVERAQVGSQLSSSLSKIIPE
jgi:hypothetical protein